MGTDKNIMPIIGLEKSIFGYIIEGRGYNGPSYQFVFCDEDGTETAFEIEGYLILSVYQHYYSVNVSLETQNVIIIDSQNNIITIGGYHVKKKYIQEITSIGDNGLAICAQTITNEDKFGTKPHFFHPVSYLNLKDSPHIIDLKKGIFWNQKYYLFSIMNMHFIVDIENTKFENPDDFTYHLIDEYGNTIYTWNKDNQIKCIWRREDGTFTIFTISNCDKDDYEEYDSDMYDEEQYNKLTLISVNNNYINLTFTDYKKEREEEYIPSDDEILLDGLSISHADYIEWKRGKSISEESYVIKSDELKSLNFKLGYNDYSNIDLYYYGLFCDNDYFIVKQSCGFISFDHKKLLATTNLSNFIPIDRYDCFDPCISECEYRNGIIGLQLKKCIIDDSPEDNSKYDKKIGNYRLYDLYGNCIGELKDDVLETPVNGIGITQSYGVVNTSDFSFIIPPIFKEIVPLNRYILHEENDKITNPIDNDSNSGPKKLMSLSEYWAKKYRIIEDKRLYIVTQEIGYGGRVLHGLFENNKELVPLGDNDIKKISGQYVLIKDTSQSLYKLVFHNGKVLIEGVKDAIVTNVYNVIVHGSSTQIQHSEVAPMLHFSRIYMENGFRVMIEDKCLINDNLMEMTPVLYTNDDIFYSATLINGTKILLSIKKGVIVSNFEGANITNISSVFNHQGTIRRPHSYISHIIKYGDALTDTMRNYINMDLWGHTIHPEMYINYNSEDAILIKCKDKYRMFDKSYIEGDVLHENMSENLTEQTTNSPIIVDDISFIGRYEEFEQNDLVLRIETNDGKCGYYSIAKGWLVQPEKVEIRDIYDNYLIFNQNIISKDGSLRLFNSLLKPVNKIGQISAYYESSQNKYLIIDSDGHVNSELQEIEPNILTSNELDSYHESQIILNVTTKKLQIKTNPNYKKDSFWCPDPNEWTDEDAWDAMTDGMYGTYPGYNWDSEWFGH